MTIYRELYEHETADEKKDTLIAEQNVAHWYRPETSTCEDRCKALAHEAHRLTGEWQLMNLKLKDALAGLKDALALQDDLIAQRKLLKKVIRQVHGRLP
jgi:hypothetical protein